LTYVLLQSTLLFKVHCILEAAMDGSAVVPPDEAARTLTSIRATRERTRADLRAYWYPLVVFGVLTLLSTPFFELWDGAGAGLFWLVAAPVGIALVVRHYRRRELSVGLTSAPRPYVVTAVCLVAACFALGFGGGIADDPDVANFGPPLAVAVAYLVYAWLERTVLLALLACALAGLTVALAVGDIERANQIVAAADGASFVLVGLLARTWSSRR
jgi:hypothetical protein